MSTVFVSYAREDREDIDGILRSMRSAAVDYWLDESDILPTMEFNEQILHGLQSCSWYLLVMTPRSAKSEYVKDELQWALNNRVGKIVPVMLEPCNPAAFHLRMMRIQQVDLASGNGNGPGQLDKPLKLIKDTDEGSYPIEEEAPDQAIQMLSLLLTFIPRHHQKHLQISRGMMRGKATPAGVLSVTNYEISAAGVLRAGGKACRLERLLRTVTSSSSAPH